MFDVLIVGGGPVGACAGALLRPAGAARPLRVALLEPRPPAAPAALPDPRVVALSRASERVLKACGAWQFLPAERLSPYERMRIWHENVGAHSDSVLLFDAADVGEPNLGYILENRLLQAALLQAFEAGGGELHAVTLTGLKFDAEGVEVATTGETLRARLVIGADGANSALRRAAGLSARSTPYAQTAIVATIATERAHQACAWQRFLKSGTLAFLPLADGTSSIVWSADEVLAAQLLAMQPDAFTTALDEASDLALGHTRLTSARFSFALQRLSATRYVTERVALIGDAAHVVHPLAGQGVNLGLLDAAVLSEEITQAVAEREDPGALRVLRAYERWRKSEIAALAGAIDAFDKLLAHGSGPLAQLAQRGLALVNRSDELRRFFIRRALGVSGELPRTARLG